MAEDLLEVVTYPAETEINVPVVIQGRYNPDRIVRVVAIAEDRFPLKVLQTPAKGLWEIPANNGFRQAGLRWVRVQGFDQNEVLVDDDLFRMVVRPPALTFTVRVDTVFKASTSDSRLLSNSQKADLKAGTQLRAHRYGALDNHFKVYLTEPVPPVGNFGYLWQPHVEVALPWTLRCEIDTWFGMDPLPPQDLPSDRRVALPAGTILNVLNHTAQGNYVRVQLAQPLAPVGSEGFLRRQGLTLSRLGETLYLSPLPEVPLAEATVQITHPTFFKRTTDQASQLPEGDRAALTPGTNYPVLAYSCERGHFRVRLAETVPPVGREGFFFAQHVLLTRNGQPIPYDPNLRVLTARRNTFFKKYPLDTQVLDRNDRVELLAGQTCGVLDYALTKNHARVTLTTGLPPVGDRGYVYLPHVHLQQGEQSLDPQPERRVLGVVYFSQRDNPRDPLVTCNVTSIAMVLYFHGVRPQRPGTQLEDELYQWIIDRQGRSARGDNSVLQRLYYAYGFRGGFNTNRTWAQIRHEIDQGRPVVVGGQFVRSPAGHIICVIGYTREGFIVHDPYGDARTGYTVTEGPSLLYTYSFLTQELVGDGNTWAHFILPNGRSL